jgi:hypothetical protein
MNKLAILTGIILTAALTRLLPHPMNFSPIAAMALFGGAYFGKRSTALLIPLASLWFSDLVLNNTIYASFYKEFTWITPSFYWSYGVFALLALAGTAFLQKPTTSRVLGSSLIASLVFFFVSNFGVWLESGMYPKTATGLTACYAAGLPFLSNTIVGDLVYTGILFGAYQWIQNKYLVKADLN